MFWPPPGRFPPVPGIWAFVMLLLNISKETSKNLIELVISERFFYLVKINNLQSTF